MAPSAPHVLPSPRVPKAATSCAVPVAAVWMKSYTVCPKRRSRVAGAEIVAIHRHLRRTRNPNDDLNGPKRIDVIPDPCNGEPTLKEKERDLEPRLAWGFLGASDPERQAQHLVAVVVEVERAGHPWLTPAQVVRSCPPWFHIGPVPGCHRDILYHASGYPCQGNLGRLPGRRDTNPRSGLPDRGRCAHARHPSGTRMPHTDLPCQANPVMRPSACS